MTALEALRDARSRVTRALEAFTDGEPGLAVHLLVDLAADLCCVIEQTEREATP